MSYIQVIDGEDTYFCYTLEDGYAIKKELEWKGRRNVVVEEVK